MSSTVANGSAARHLERLENLSPSMAKADLNKVEAWRATVGQAVRRCFDLAGVTQKEAAALIGREPAQIARWIAATERPQFDSLFAVERFRQPLVQALSEMAGAEVEVTVRWRRVG